MREHTAACGRSWSAEAAGTALLVAAIVLAAAATLHAGAARHLALAAIVAPVVAVIALSPLGRGSGAHLNPAVTLGLWALGRMTPRDVAGYVAAQAAGAAAGAWLAAALLPGAVIDAIGGAVTHPAVPAVAALGLEAAMTVALLAVVFAGWSPGMILPVLAALIWLGSPATGASFNPARSEGPALVFGDLADLWIYLAAPSAAALAFGLVWRRV